MENQNPNASASPQPLSAILSNLTSTASLNPQNSTSTPLPPEKSLSTIGAPKENPCAIGRPPSAIVLDKLRGIAQSVLLGKLLDDQALETLLAQHFTSSRFASKPIVKNSYGKDGYDYEITGYAIKLDAVHDDEMALFTAVEFLNRPASHEFVTRQLARLRTVMARAQESNQDLAVLIDTYDDHLAQFPSDIVKTVCDRVIDNRKWFPLVSELRTEMDALLRYRKSLLEAFERCRSPMLPKNVKPLLEADARLGVHWKMLSRKDWLPQHYDWWIGEAEDMLRMANETPAFIHKEVWQPELERRRAARAEAMMQPCITP